MNETVKKIELRLADVHKNLPHLPLNSQKWLAYNIWWIVLIGAILTGISVFALVLFTLIGGVFLAGAAFLLSARFGGLALLLALIIIALIVVNLVVSIMAIAPLKTHMRNGWLLLAASLMISFVVAVLTDIVKQDISAIIKEIVFLAVGLYVIFEIRNYFTHSLASTAVARKG